MREPLCRWQWGAGDCSQLLLPRGEPMPEVQAMAKRLNVLAFNPCILRWDTLVVRAQPLDPDGLVRLDESQSLLLVKGRVVAKVDDTEDSRAVILPDGRMIMVSVRAHFVKRSHGVGADSTTITARWVHSDGTVSPSMVLRTPPGWSVKQFEKNWIPFLYEGQLFLSYSLEPHVVFQCKLPRIAVAEVRCQLAFLSTSPAIWRPVEALFKQFHQPNHAKGARGGTPLVSIRGALPGWDGYLGIAHFHSSATELDMYPAYFHFFYLLAARPPFRVTNVSPPFRFLASRHWTGRSDRVQFASGLMREGWRLIVTYGVNDSLSMRTVLELPKVVGLLRAGLSHAMRNMEKCTLQRCNDTGDIGQTRCEDEAACISDPSRLAAWYSALCK